MSEIRYSLCHSLCEYALQLIRCAYTLRIANSKYAPGSQNEYSRSANSLCEFERIRYFAVRIRANSLFRCANSLCELERMSENSLFCKIRSARSEFANAQSERKFALRMAEDFALALAFAERIANFAVIRCANSEFRSANSEFVIA